MNWTRTDATRRRIAVIGLLVGPCLLALSNAFETQPNGDSMRSAFDAMTDHPNRLLVQSLLEAIGFMIVLAAYVGTLHALRSRGGALGTWGGALCSVGILGFGFSAFAGTTFYVLAKMPDHDAGFAAAMALVSDGANNAIGMALMIAGQIGICLVIGGLIRARVSRVWPLVLVVAGIVVNFTGGLILTTLIADLLLLGASSWVALALARSAKDGSLKAQTQEPELRTSIAV